MQEQMGRESSEPAEWIPPGRDCGACGLENCAVFVKAVQEGIRKNPDCPFYSPHPDPDTRVLPDNTNSSSYQFPQTDILGNPLDFAIVPLPGESSARKILLPFRPDMVERWNIQPGDILTGRPMGAGCPVQHVLQVISASINSGLLTCHVVGPAFSRGREVKDLEAYHMIGFEGIAVPITKEPEFGRRMRFLPGFCMMNVGHTGVVNMVLSTKAGLHVRVEDIVIL